MAFTIEQANEYIASNSAAVDNTYKPKYHMTPPVGWMNDPNGLVYFGGEYHLFYQFHPYAVAPGVMHWGHFVSDDLISYRNDGVALCPSGADETSCYSGGALVASGALEILYTRHYEISDIRKEQVCIVKSSDARSFTKFDRAVFDNEKLPENISRADFRDPYPVRVGDKFYVFVGGKDVTTDKGVVVVLCGNSLDALEYDFMIGPFYEFGDMAECPSYCRVGDKDVLIVSGCHVDERDGCFKNTHASVFIIGEIDFAGKCMRVDRIKEIDKGDSFYAPQIVSNAQVPVMIGWLEMWNKSYPTREMGHGWAGAFSVPREIAFDGDEIVQRPVAALDKYVKPCDGKKSLPKSSVIEATLCRGASIVVRGVNGQFAIGNDGGVYLDTLNANNMNGCIRTAQISGEAAKVKIVTDVSTVEVFIDGGRSVISSRYYIDGELKLICDRTRDVRVFEIGGYNED